MAIRVRPDPADALRPPRTRGGDAGTPAHRHRLPAGAAGARRAAHPARLGGPGDLRGVSGRPRLGDRGPDALAPSAVPALPAFRRAAVVIDPQLPEAALQRLTGQVLVPAFLVPPVLTGSRVSGAELHARVGAGGFLLAAFAEPTGEAGSLGVAHPVTGPPGGGCRRGTGCRASRGCCPRG